MVAGDARRWYTSAVPHRRRARRFGAHPAVSASAPSFLPPQPLSERGRRRGIAGRVGRRGLAIGALAIALVVLLPVGFAAFGPSVAPLQPLGGGVAGAVSNRRTEPSPASSAAPTDAAIDAEGARYHVINGDTRLTFGSRFPPRIATLTGYAWPIQKGRITLPFKAIPGGTRINDGKLFHDGVDMASFCGAPVGAAHDGVVLAAGRHFDEQVGWIGDLQPYLHLLDVRHMWADLPNAVVIDDGNGYRSIYAHFRDVTVRVGQEVKAGELIGHEGATGHASGCHVHYGLFSPFETKTFGVRADILRRLRVPRYEIARIDPLAVLPGGDVALRTRSIAKAIAAAAAIAAAKG
jgi:murein DD-endopeptidase MepM/ murein hydrolase activator NlpD